MTYGTTEYKYKDRDLSGDEEALLNKLYSLQSDTKTESALSDYAATLQAMQAEDYQDPQLESRLEKERSIRISGLEQKHGANYASTTAGIQSMGEFDAYASGERVKARQGWVSGLANTTTQTLQAATQAEQAGENLLGQTLGVLASRPDVMTSQTGMGYDTGSILGGIGKFLGGATQAGLISSDIILKENITDFKAGLKEILRIDPITYNWKQDKDEEKFSGVSAQNVQDVLPEAVHMKEHLRVDPMTMIATLVNAIKELKTEVDNLKGESKNA